MIAASLEASWPCGVLRLKFSVALKAAEKSCSTPVRMASAILTGVEQDFSAAFNATLNFNLNTPQGQLASSEAAIIDYFYQLFVYYTQQVDPSYASGRMQD